MATHRTSWFLAAVLAAPVLVSCGDDDGTTPKDAAVQIDTAPSKDTPVATDTLVVASPDAPALPRDVLPDVPVAMDAPVDRPQDATSPDAGDGGTDARLSCGPFAGGDASPARDALTKASPSMSFFVTSTVSATGNLGGLAGADTRCQTLASHAGVPSASWRAYLSVEHDPPVTGAPVHARDRIGKGPWYNAYGVLVAADLAALHARGGDPSIFVDEHGRMINGQWTTSPTPNEHDILTGSNPDGTVAVGKTCADWTSALGPSDGGAGGVARVGHSDGIGPQCNTATSPTNYTSWNSSHDNAGCNDTAPRGGAGRIYCFLAL